MIDNLVRPEIKDFIPYNANQVPYRIKLDANESPYELPEAVKLKLADYIMSGPSLNLYPDTDSIELRKALADYWDADFNGIVVGNGLDQIIQVLVNVYVGKGDKVLCPAPSFSMYSMSVQIAGGVPVEVPLKPENGYRYDVNEIIEVYEKEKPKIIFLCTPNNPTGNILEREEIHKILNNCKNSIVIVDEAYADFCGTTVIPDIPRYGNLVVLRTFSKAYGLAGIRCGYSLSSVAIAGEMNKVRPPYNINTLSQMIAKLVLEEKSTIERLTGYIVEQRERIISELSRYDGVVVYPSQANFVLVKVKDGAEFYNELFKRGILVRSFGNARFLENCVRISVGSREQTEILLNELKMVLS